MIIRKLNGNDIFKMSKILKKINFDIKDINITELKTDRQNVSDVQIVAGVEIFKRVLENIHLAQDEVNDFLGGLCGCTGKEFGEKDLDEIAEIMIEFTNMIKGSNFFTYVSKLM